MSPSTDLRRTGAGATVAPRASDIPRLERENAAARAALLREGTTAPVALHALVERLAAGLDYGAAAILQDARGGARAHLLPHTRLDPRTRDALPLRDDDAFVLRQEPVPVRTHDGVPDTLSPLPTRAVHAVGLGSLTLASSLQPGSGEHLVVTFVGALDRERTRLPRFERLRTLGTIGFPLLAVSDPTLDLAPGLRLGWYLGSAGVDLHERVAGFVRAAMRATGTTRVLLVGTSGGGFAALQVGTFLPEAHVIAMNPQTDVERYHAALSRRAVEDVFGRDATSVDRRRTSVPERLAGSPGPGRITAVLNAGDEHHVVEHGEPLLEHLRVHRPDVRVDETRVDWGSGHVGPPTRFLDDLVRDAVDRPRPATDPASPDPA